MSAPIEFNEFYRLLTAVRDGGKEEKKELEWILAEYEHAKDSKSSFDELGQIFCHIGVMELFEYTGSDNIRYISSLNLSVWEYLKIRIGKNLDEYLEQKMITHSKEHGLTEKISNKWKIDATELEMNLNDLAKYVAEGIVNVIS